MILVQEEDLHVAYFLYYQIEIFADPLIKEKILMVIMAFENYFFVVWEVY